MKINRQTEIVLAFIIMTVVPLFFIGIFSYHQAKIYLESEILARLKIVANSKEIEIVDFINESKRRAEDFGSDQFIREETEKINAVDGFAAKRQIGAALDEYLKNVKLPLDADMTDLHVYDPDGNLLASVDDGDMNEATFSGDAAQSFITKGKAGTYVVNTRLHHGKAAISFVTPLRGVGSDKVIGVLMTSYGIKNLTGILLGNRARQNGLAVSTHLAELSSGIFIANQDKRIISAAGKTVNNHLPRQLADNEAVIECITKGAEITKESVNSEGLAVLTTSICPNIEKDWRWVLVVEEDKTEALAPVFFLKKLMIVIGFFATLFAAVMAYFVSRCTSHSLDSTRCLSALRDGKKK